MSDVVQKIREKYPQYENVSDEELTLRIGSKYPQYLDRDPQFKQDFQTQVGTLGLKAAISGQGALLNTLTSPAAGEASEMGRQEGEAIRETPPPLVQQLAGTAKLTPKQREEAIAAFQASPIPEVHLEGKTLHGKIGAAAVNVADQLARGVVSPMGAFLAPLGMAGAVPRTAMAVGFGAPLAAESLKKVYKGTALGDPQMAIEGVIGTGAAGAMLGGAASEIIPRAQITETAKVAPLTAQALQQQITGEALKMPEGAKPETVTKPVERTTPDAIHTETAPILQPLRNEPRQGEGEVPAEVSRPKDDEGRGEAPAQQAQEVAAANRPAVKLMPQESGQQQIIPAERKADGTWETHNEIIERAKLSTEDIDRRIFVDEQGNEKSREQTAQDLEKQGVPTAIPGQAHSTDVNAAIEAKQEVAPAVIPKPVPNLDLVEDATEFIKSANDLKRPPKTAEEALEQYKRNTAVGRSRGEEFVSDDEFKSLWQAFQKPPATPEPTVEAKGGEPPRKYTEAVSREIVRGNLPEAYLGKPVIEVAQTTVLRGSGESTTYHPYVTVRVNGKKVWRGTPSEFEGKMDQLFPKGVLPAGKTGRNKLFVEKLDEPPPPAPVSGAGTPEPAVAAQKVEDGAAKLEAELKDADEFTSKAAAVAEDAVQAWAKHVEDVVNPLKAKIRKIDYEVFEMQDDANRTKPEVKGKKHLTKKAFFEKYGVDSKEAAIALWDQKKSELADLEKQLEAAETKRKELELAKERRGKEWSAAATRAGELRRQVYPKVREGDVGQPTPAPPEKGAPEVVAPPPESRKPAQILGESARVKVSAPEGATVLRVTDTKGRTSTLSLSEVNKGDNPFHGVEVRKLEAGSIGKDKKFNVVKGDVEVKDLAQGPGTGAGPGSPAVSQGPDPKAQIEALEESFRGVAGKKISLVDQIKQASNIGQRAAQAKDVLSTAISGLKATGDYLIKKWEGVKNWDDMLRAKGELSAEIEKRGWRVRQFIKTVEKAMPDKKQRAAIAKWVDAGGDMAELQRGAAETKPEFRQAYLDAINLKGDELVAAQNIRNYFESRLDEAIDAGVLEHGVEDYLHRIYERDPTAAKKMIAYVQAGVIKPNPALAKKRVFQADWEAEKLGYKPVQDFLPRVADYEASLAKAIASRAFIRKTLDMTAADGRPIVDIKGVGIPIEDSSGVREATLIKPKSNPVKSNDPADAANYRGDYVNREYPSLSKWKWAGTDAAGKPIFLQGDVAIHPQYVGRIDALLEPSRIRYAKKPLARTVARTAIGISSTVKQTMLDFSGFHQVQITVHGLEHRVLPWKIVQDIDFQNPNVDGLLRGGVTLGGEYYGGNLSEGLVGRSLSRMIPGLGPLMQSYHEWLFQSYIPRIKMTMALHALDRNRSRYAGKMSEEQIFAKTAAEANSAFGELNYITLERSQTARDISRIILLAPDFLEARGRFAGGALEKGGKAFGQEQRTALLLGALTMYVTARLVNKATDDQYHFEPENAFSIVHGNKAYGLRTVQGDILHLLERPYQFWLSRLNPVFGRTLLEAATQRDYFGRKRTLPQQAWDAVSTMMPIALRTGRERALWESLLNGFGVTARRWNDVDDAFKLAQEWKKKNLPRSKWEKGEFIYDPDKDALRGLKVALSNGDDGGAVKEIKKLIESKTITHQELNRYFDRYAAMPFTGSQSNDRKFLAGLTEDQRKTVTSAREHKKQIRKLYRNAYGQYSDAVNQAAPQ